MNDGLLALFGSCAIGSLIVVPLVMYVLFVRGTARWGTRAGAAADVRDDVYRGSAAGRTTLRGVPRAVSGPTTLAAMWAGLTLTSLVPFAWLAFAQVLSWAPFDRLDAEWVVPLAVTALIGTSGLAVGGLVSVASWRLTRREPSAPSFARHAAQISHVHHVTTFLLWALMTGVAFGGRDPFLSGPMGLWCLLGLGAGAALRSAGIAAEAHTREEIASELPPPIPRPPEQWPPTRS